MVYSYTLGVELWVTAPYVFMGDIMYRIHNVIDMTSLDTSENYI